MSGEEDEFFREIFGEEFLDDEDIEVRKAIVRDLISDDLEMEGHPPSLAKRMATIPEILSKLTGEVAAARNLAEKLDDERARERLVEYLVSPIAIFIENNSSSKLEREAMIEEATQKLRKLLSSQGSGFRDDEDIDSDRSY